MKVVKTILILTAILLVILFPMHILAWGIMLGFVLVIIAFFIMLLRITFGGIDWDNAISDDEALMAYYLLKKKREREKKEQ